MVSFFLCNRVEDGIKSRRKLYNFQDFLDCVNESGHAERMEAKDFIDFRSEKGSASDVRTPKLRSISHIEFRKGDSKFYWKYQFDGTLKVTEFLKKSSRKDLKSWAPYPGKGGDRGVNHAKKQEILKKLCPFLVVENKAEFWDNLPSSANSADRTVNIEHLAPREE